ncbi:sulfotransferase family 2 domain-containing protein [Autumnicola psychrophila]|uniref:Sulfotransferase family 2 domain-containing protein n=1 Tax=Autumnicola psychrophila TaxID=3075592 RepID=A0ABU3DTS7_9FLAO|nr:sulfotransferase family 2 domain-containing protein [Zunongwangia sp. F225]MDT0686864.1 sulfotransferase family 2 domain-containing protein [Zunongwangia sp. F225]
MISHKHKCIFIHISKCAGSSVETAFGIDIMDNTEKNNVNLFGWNQEHKLFLQHATPQQLLNYNFIDRNTWDSYYKFIIVRNPWDRAFSDYTWLCREQKIQDSFFNFLHKQEKFKKVLNEKNKSFFRGDHLNSQISYFFLNGEEIKFDKVIRFENLENELPVLAKRMGLNPSVFNRKVNALKRKINHYSRFYSEKRKKLIEKKYPLDIEFLDYYFEDKRRRSDYLRFKFKSSYSFAE